MTAMTIPTIAPVEMPLAAEALLDWAMSVLLPLFTETDGVGAGARVAVLEEEEVVVDSDGVDTSEVVVGCTVSGDNGLPITGVVGGGLGTESGALVGVALGVGGTKIVTVGGEGGSVGRVCTTVIVIGPVSPPFPFS